MLEVGYDWGEITGPRTWVPVDDRADRGFDHRLIVDGAASAIIPHRVINQAADVALAPDAPDWISLMMTSRTMSRRDIDFLLHEWLDTGGLLARTPFTELSRETVDAVLDLAEDLATAAFAPHNRTADLNEPTFDGCAVTVLPEIGLALEKFADAGFLAAPLPRKAGGLGMPSSVFNACMSWFYAANTGTSGYALLTLAAGNLLAHHGSPEMVESCVKPMMAGRFFGTMALSEPHAGSNLADITTRAEPQSDGTYRIFGRKSGTPGVTTS